MIRLEILYTRSRVWRKTPENRTDNILVLPFLKKNDSH